MALTLCMTAWCCGMNAQETENHVLVLDGYSDRAILSHSSLEGALKQGALEFWCRASRADEASCLFRFLEPFLEASIGYSPERNGMTILAFGSDWKRIGSLDLQIEIEKWFHLAIVWNESELIVYYNGSIAAQTLLEVPLGLPRDHFNLYLGGFDGIGKRDFDGQVDSIRLWDQPLTADQIRQSQEGESIENETSLAAAWEFEKEPHSYKVVFEGNAHIQNLPTPVSWKWGDWHRLSGVVQNMKGEPIGGCSIYWNMGRGWQRAGSTSPAGGFELFFEGEPTGRNLLFEHGTSRKRVVMEPDDFSKEVGFQIQLPPAHVSVSGNVMTMDERMPVAGVFVEARELHENGEAGPVFDRDLTDQRGSYKFHDLPQGDYLLQVSDDDLPSSSKDAGLMEHRRNISIKNSSIHQRVDLKCPPIASGNWDYFDNTDGIPGYALSLIMDDPNGLWTYSHRWLRLFTGMSFKEVVKIPDEWGNFAGGAAIPGGGLCVGTQGTDGIPPALHFFNAKGKTGQLPAPENETPNKVAFGKGNELYVLGGDQVFWLSDWKSAVKTHPSEPIQWKSLKVPSSHLLATGPNGEVWTAGTGGLTLITDTRNQRYDAANGLVNARINDLKISMDGTVWIATTRGLGKLQDGHFQWILDDSKPWTDLNALELGISEEAWLGTVSMGLLKVSKSGISKIDDATFPINDRIYGIARGPDQTLFVSSSGALRRYRPNRLQRFDEANGLPTDVPTLSISVSGDSKQVILGTAWHGPQFFDGRQFKSLPKNHLFGKSYIRSMGLTPEGEPWMCSNFGLSFVRNFDIIPVEPPHPFNLNDHFTTCAIGPDGEAWIGRGWAGGGLIRLEAEKYHHKIFGKKDGLEHENVWAVDVGKDGRLLVGTERGLFEYDGKAFRHPDKVGELSNLDVYGIESLPNGNIWVATSKGIYGINEKGSFKLSIPGLPDDFMTWNVLVDSADILWIATDAYGAIGFDGDGFTFLSMRQGLPSNVVYDVKEGWNREIWFATNGGAARLTRKLRTQKLTNLRVYSAGDRVRSIGGKLNILAGAPIKIEFDWTNIAIPAGELSLVTKATHDTSGYQELLVSSSHVSSPLDWNPQKKGDYTMEITLRDPDFNRSEPAILKFDVALPWHKDPYKLVPTGVLLLLLLGGMIAFLVKGHLHRRKSNRIMAEMLNEERNLRTAMERKNCEINKMKELALSAAKQADEANRAKSFFVANMSHEIRSPLNAVLGYAQILKRDHNLSDSPLHAVNSIEKSGEHLLHLIDDILELSRIESGRLEAKPILFNLPEMTHSLADIIQVNCEQKGIQWSLEWFETSVFPPDNNKPRNYLDEMPQMLWANEDESKLKQILLNLLSNAVKFTQQGGIRLEVGLPSHWKNIGERETASLVYFEVSDTGKGIAIEEKETIMNPFSQGRDVTQLHGGVGLGLAISRKLVEFFGGSIDLDSTPGEGSRFFFTVNLRLQSRGITPPQKQAGHLNLQTIRPLKVLIADDIAANREVLYLMLRGIGVIAEEAENGVETLEKARANRPDLVFLDIAMPEMDGFKTLEHLRAMGSSPKKPMTIFAVSAGVINQEKESCLEAGFDGFIAKPVRLPVLNRLLLEWFPDHFRASEIEHKDISDMEEMFFDAETNQHFRELAENCAVSEIVRLGESFLKHEDPLYQNHARAVIHLAKMGRLEELAKKLTPKQNEGTSDNPV